ncbi:hypothetical protein [Flavobacterium sp.]|uniref:hypothetical protein n=1 Tax=Flavobacterium sp. TaxID=239 RepID=UPI0039E2ED79
MALLGRPVFGRVSIDRGSHALHHELARALERSIPFTARTYFFSAYNLIFLLKKGPAGEAITINLKLVAARIPIKGSSAYINGRKYKALPSLVGIHCFSKAVNCFNASTNSSSGKVGIPIRLALKFNRFAFS